MKRVKAVYCFYPSNFDRPSGFFGRALQLNKAVIIKLNGYLDRKHGSQKNVFPIEKIEDIKSLILTKISTLPVNYNRQWDNSQTLKEILM